MNEQWGQRRKPANIDIKMMERLDNISLYGVGNNFHSNDEDSSRKEKSEKKRS